MPAKRKKTAETGHGASADPVEQEQSIDEKPSAKPIGLKTSVHGNMFQLKLLVLFLIRGIKAKYQFKLGTEIPGMGGKFDDLIFRYQVVDEDSMTQKVQTERYRYLQAKHKQNEESDKITAANLLNDNDGDFSLPKYFRSYYREVINGTKGCPPDDVRDCIICTNVGFDDELKLKETGIELIRLDEEDEMLTFDKVSVRKSPTRYKLKKTEALLLEMAKWSEIHLLAKTLFEYATDNKKLARIPHIFKCYHFALIDENVIDKGERKLCATFMEGNSRFREILAEITFVNYCSKLNFKCDDKKKIRVDGIEERVPFEERLKTKLPKYTKLKTQSMEMDLSIFEDFDGNLVSENIINAVGRKKNDKSFTAKFIQGKDLSEKGSEFRRILRNAVFTHFWKDLTFTLSEDFGRKIISSAPDESKSLNDLVGDKETGDFLDKLVFAVHTPNEVELDDIFKKEMGDRYSLHESDFKSDFILRNMLDWFKSKESTFMTSAEGVDILENAEKKMKSLRLTAVSIDYQRKLRADCELNREFIREMAEKQKEVCHFTKESIKEMVEKLKKLLNSKNRVEQITTQLPNRTALKVIAALKELRRSISPETPRDVIAQEEIYFQRKDSYLMVSFSEFQKNYVKFQKTLKSDTTRHLLIVIGEDGASTDDETYYEELVKETTEPKKVIFISKAEAEIKDVLKFTDFSNEFKKTLLSKEISFQGTTLAVSDLIKTRSDQTVEEFIQSGEPEEILNVDSIEELIKQEKSQIQIPSFSSTRFERSLYIKRQLTSAFPLDREFWGEVVKQLNLQTSGRYSLEELQSECRVSDKGEIEWNVALVNDEQTKKIWEKMNFVTEKRKLLAVSTSNALKEDDLSIHSHEKHKLPGVVIISGVAGAGKSSILSHYYEEMKEKDPDHWVIVINLTDHSKDFLKLNSDEVNLSTTIEWLVNLSVVVGNSPFGRSMLRRRLELGDRITILFDGFDEIVKSQHQESAIRVISVLNENKSAGLYVTTRSHTASDLQFRLSQLTYNLEDFSKDDQINYLTSLWKRHFTVDVNLRHFGGLLVDRISNTLNDGERSFIGIPLQCRILAECFETEVQNSAQNKPELNSLLESIEQMNLDVANLYRLLLTKKRKIYEEKKALSRSHDLGDSHANSDIDNLEYFLIKLAIKTIVSTKEQVSVLLGTQQNSMKSKGEQLKKTEKRLDHCARFGLLERNADGKVQFLHRTYAEYMMAEYLYTGFLLDDDKRNRLLDFDSSRKLIVDQILVKEQYDGVQVFFNSMLNEMVERNEEWRAIVVQGELPERLFKFSEVLFRQFLRQTRKPHSNKHPNALLCSVRNRKEKIFRFLCDCLDANFDKSDVLRAMTISFLSSYVTENFIFTLDVFRHQSIEVFQRFLGYYDSDLQDSEGKTHAELLMDKFFDGLLLTDLEDSYWNARKQQNMMDCLLDFMDKKLVDVEHFFQPWKEYSTEALLATLMQNKHYEKHFEKFLKLLLKTSAYSNDSTLAIFIKNVCSSVARKIRQERRLVKILGILYQERESLAIKVFGLLFSIEPEIFQNYFRPLETRDIFNGETKEILHFWSERDLFGITPLHRAVFNNEIDAIEKMLLLVQENSINGDDAHKNMSTRVVNVMCYDENGFTPFYVAAARGNEIVYRKMLLFLKDFNGEQNKSGTLEKILTATNGFVYHALSDAMESENLEMFQVILSAIKYILGQNSLLNLLKSNSRGNKSKHRYEILDFWSDTIFGVACRYNDLFQKLAKIVVEQKDNSREAYQDWNELVFHLLKTENFNQFTFKYVNNEVLQGMMSQQGSSSWTKRVLDLRIWEGFEMLSSRLIKNFREDQLKELITMLTNSSFKNNRCYWCEILNEYKIRRFANNNEQFENNAISQFMKCVKEKLGESFVYDLVIHADSNVTIRPKVLTNFLLLHLSEERQEKAKQYWKENSSITINDTFFTRTSEAFWLNDMERQEKARQYWKENSSRTINDTVFTRTSKAFWLNKINLKGTNYFEDIMWFYLDHGSHAQLEVFIETITSVHTIGRKQRSMWSYVFKNDRATNKIIKHVSENIEIFGGEAAKTLLFHVDKRNPRFLNAIWWKKDVDELLAQLPEVVQEGIQQYIQERAFGLIEELFNNPYWLIAYKRVYTTLNTLTLMVNYSNTNQLKQFIQYIKALRNFEGNNSSIWCWLNRGEIEEDCIRMMGKFLKSVLEKFGSSAVKGLLLHVDDGGEKGVVPFIYFFALFGEEKFVETMLSYLDLNHREKVQRKMNKYLDKKFDIPANRRTKEIYPGRAAIAGSCSASS